MSVPVVFLVYKRLAHTKLSFECIKKFKPRKLFIVADGPKNKKEGLETKQVIDFLRSSIDWKCDIKWNVSQKNLGLAKRVSSGITWAFEHCEKAIVLEDDCIPDLTFFTFCEELLEHFNNNERVGCITGNNFQDGINRGSGSYYFSNFPHCWGWATWKRAWRHYDHDMNDGKRAMNYINDKYDSKTLQYWEWIKAKVENGHLDSWAYRWTFSLWAKNILTVTPNKNLVENIGHGHDSTHTKTINQSPKESLSFPLKHPNKIARNHSADKFAMRNHFKADIDPPPQERFTCSDFSFVQKRKRFKQFSVKFLGHKINAVDSGSLLSQNKEIFGNEVYKFDCTSPSPFIIDVGANIGLSIIYFKRLFPKSRIIAFEPDPKLFKYLNYNLKSFSIQGVETVSKVCRDKKGLDKFKQDHPDGGGVERESLGSDLLESDCVRLSTYINKPVDFLKIGADGSEWNILEECRFKLKLVRHLFIEYHSYLDQDQNLSRILLLLEKSGFRYYLKNSVEKLYSPFCKRQKSNEHRLFDFQANIFCINSKL